MALDLFQNNNKFLMLALDQRGSFKRMAASDDSQVLISIKKKIINTLSHEFSGLLIDPDWGLPAYEKKDKPFLLCIEKSGYEETAGGRLTELAYTVNQLKDLGASGVKLLVYFNPLAGNCQHQIKISQRVLTDCQTCGLPLFLEIVTYNLQDKLSKSDLILKSLDLFLKNNIQPDVFKLEFPGSIRACQEISAKLKNIPWVLLTAGKPFDVFKSELKTAAENGAAGFLAGRAIWQQVFKYPADKQTEFLKTTSLTRFQEIKNIMLAQPA